MDLHEVARIIDGLRELGVEDGQILDFILWVGTGDERYKPVARQAGTAHKS